jgi:hypothetical protein
MKEENIQVHVQNFREDIDGYEHDYDIIKNGDDVQLFCSKSGDWDTPGAMIGSLLDDGNGVRIKIEDKEIDLDYSIAQQLLVLLLMNNDTRMKFISVKTIKTI